MKIILLIFLPFIFIYDLILSKISNNHTISNRSYLLMRYFYKYSDGILLHLISLFLNGFRSKLPSTFSESFSSHRILDINQTKEIFDSIIQTSIINNSIYGEKLRLKNDDDNLDFEYYKNKNLIRLDFNPQELVKNKQISDFATNPYWVKEVENILGTKPYFVGIDAWLTLPPPIEIKNYDEIGEHLSSQMWHRDCDNLRDIKIMTYLTDVKDITCGPFEIVKSTNKFSFFNPNKYIMGSGMRVKDQYVQNNLKESIFSFLGSKGETIIADTRALHRGKTITNKKMYRIMLQFYFSNHKFGKVKLLQPPSNDWESFDTWKKCFNRNDCYYDCLFHK